MEGIVGPEEDLIFFCKAASVFIKQSLSNLIQLLLLFLDECCILLVHVTDTLQCGQLQVVAVPVDAVLGCAGSLVSGTGL